MTTNTLTHPAAASKSILALSRRHACLIVLSLTFVLALTVRLVDISSNPPGFFTDEAAFGYSAYKVLHTARDEHGAFLPLFFRSFGEYKLPLFIYAEIPFVAVLGLTETAVRATAALLGGLTVLSTYLLAKELFKRELPALAAAVFLAIMPWHIHYSRTGLGDLVSFPLVLTLAIYFFLRGLSQPRLLYVAAVGFGLSFYSYRAAWVVVPPLLLVLGVLYRRELWQQRGVVLGCTGIVALLLLPVARHVLSDTGDRAGQVSIFHMDTDESTLSIFWRHYRSYFTYAFLFSKADQAEVLRHYLPGQGVLYLFQLPLILGGFVCAVVSRNRAFAIVLALLVLYPLPGALTVDSPISSRTLLGSVVYALLTAGGLVLLVDVARNAGPRVEAVWWPAGVLVIAVAGAMSLGSYLQRYQHDYPLVAAGYWGWQSGPREIMQHFLAVQDRYDQLIMDGDFNAPDIFIPFYAKDACPKCKIGGVDSFEPSKRQLFALRPQNIDAEHFDYVVQDTLHYPNGDRSFLLLEIRGRH